MLVPNATAVVEISHWNKSPQTKEMRARVTPKQIKFSTRTYNRDGKRISVYGGTTSWKIISVVLDGGSQVFPTPA